MNHSKTYSLDEAKRTLENYCAYQERCHQEVYNKLKTMRMIPEAIDLIIVHLLEHDFLNETRFLKPMLAVNLESKNGGENVLNSN